MKNQKLTLYLEEKQYKIFKQRADKLSLPLSTYIRLMLIGMDDQGEFKNGSE